MVVVEEEEEAFIPKGERDPLVVGSIDETLERRRWGRKKIAPPRGASTTAIRCFL